LGFKLITESPSWLLLVCAFAGLFYAWLLYRNDKLFTESGPWLVRSMAAFRFFTVTILSIFLLSPMIRTIFKEVEKPIIVVLQDNSESITAIRDSVNFRKNYPEAMNSFLKTIEGDFDVRSFSIGTGLSEVPAYKFNDKETDLSAPINELKARFAGRNLGAIVLATDGLYNKGSNPFYAYSDFKVPIYTIGLGDTAVLKDVLIKGIKHNKNVFSGNTFPVEITVDARKCSGQNVTLSISRNDQILFSKQVAISNNRFNVLVPAFLEANQKGINHYKVSVSSLDDEINYDNNVRDFFVEVTDNRQQILLIANAPHPDLAAIKSIMDVNPNYDLKFSLISDFKGDLNGVNLLILHELPSSGNNAQSVIAAATKLEIPVLYILGSQTGVIAFNNLETGIKINNNRGNFVELLPDPNADFSLFTIDEEHLRRISSFPPLIAPFGNYIVQRNVTAILNQKVGSVKTGIPLMYFSEMGSTKIGVIAGEGIWKWRLSEFAEFSNTEATSSLFMKSVQFLATREKKTPFRLIYKNSYFENEPVVFDSEVYNEAGELINTGEVQITFVNEDGKSFPFTFSRTDKAYSLNAGYLSFGIYKFTASTKIGEKSHTESGTIIINSLQAELSETIANHQLLQSLSNRTGGNFYLSGNLNNLSEELKKRNDIKPVSYTQKKLSDVINLKWIFALLIVLLSAEWFLRKRNGAY
jgi:hypothetical protein